MFLQTISVFMAVIIMSVFLISCKIILDLLYSEAEVKIGISGLNLIAFGVFTALMYFYESVFTFYVLIGFTVIHLGCLPSKLQTMKKDA